MKFQTVAADGKNVDIEPFKYAMNLICGKWKSQILFWLWKNETMRYGEIRKAVTGITHKMLSSQLKQLEADGLIIRHKYQQVPPKMEYSLSELGQTLMPVMHEICKWGHEHYKEPQGAGPI